MLACSDLRSVLDGCRGRTLGERWRDFETRVWPSLQETAVRMMRSADSGVSRRGNRGAPAAGSRPHGPSWARRGQTCRGCLPWGCKQATGLRRPCHGPPPRSASCRSRNGTHRCNPGRWNASRPRGRGWEHGLFSQVASSEPCPSRRPWGSSPVGRHGGCAAPVDGAAVLAVGPVSRRRRRQHQPAPNARLRCSSASRLPTPIHRYNTMR